MTLPSTSRRAGPFVGDSSQTEFPFTFKIFDATDILVTVVNFAGVTTELVYGVDYDVDVNANQDSSPGGTVNYPLSGSALPSTSELAIIGNLPYDQPLDLPSGGSFPPVSIENEHDRTVMQIQQLVEITDRALKVPATSDAETELPTPEAGKVLGWDENGNIANLDGADLAGELVYANWIYEPFTGDGATTTFVLSQSPGGIANTLVSVNGLVQTPTTDYTLDGNTLTFTSAPANSAKVLVRYGEAVAQSTSFQLVHRVTATGGQTVFTIPGGYLPNQNALSVYANGIRLDGAGIDYTETDENTVTFGTGFTVGDTITFVIGVEAFGGGSGTGTDGAIRIVVVGDSLSATNAMVEDSWPNLLQTRLNGRGVRVEVCNLAINGWTFNKANTTAAFGSLTALAKTVSLRPSIVIAALGAADATLNIEGRNQSQIRADAATFFASLKASLPSVTTVYASELMYDEDLFPSAASLKNKAVSPYFHKPKPSGILAGSHCSEILDDAIDSTQQTKFNEWVSFNGYVSGLANVDLTVTLPYFKAARLGLAGQDGLHLTGMGHHFVVAAFLEAFRQSTEVADYFGDMSDLAYAPWNDIDYVFDGYLSPSGDGYVAASYDSQVHQVGKNAGLWNRVQPESWYLPSKAIARIGATPVPADGYSVPFWQIQNGYPTQEVEVSVNGAAFASSGISTDAYGCAVFPTSAGNFPAGSYELRYRVVNEIFGPFDFETTAPVEPSMLARLVTNRATGGSNTYTFVPFDSTVEDNASALSGGAYTIPRTGRYAIAANVALDALTAAGAVMVLIYKNGSRHLDGPLVYNGGGGAAIVSGGVSASLALVAGDIITIRLYHFLAAGNMIPGNTTTSSWFSVSWLGH